MLVQINGIEYDLVVIVFPLKFYSFIKGNNVYKEEGLRLKRFLIIKRFLKYDETKRTGPGIKLASSFKDANSLQSCTRVSC